ncbi:MULTISPECIES: hypothetical protein [Paenibacillus]|uniref:PaaD-like zinc ribbon domain-containing protein n=1 Tax=Paenibacillus TaxID=44249 RepID=UPI000B156DC3|nr:MULTISPECIES: hypothetical protein [Paenibacillus]
MSSKDEKQPHCSFCNSTNVVLLSRFGTAQLVRQYYCNDCRSAFEYIRWQNEDAR